MAGDGGVKHHRDAEVFIEPDEEAQAKFRERLKDARDGSIEIVMPSPEEWDEQLEQLAQEWQEGMDQVAEDMLEDLD